MREAMTVTLEPGDLVKNLAAPDWGMGQVQSVTEGKITVNFEHTGKLVIDSTHVSLAYVASK
jgi:ABC-type uncharacterized transport system YnjBCD ATPase subunit